MEAVVRESRGRIRKTRGRIRETRGVMGEREGEWGERTEKNIVEPIFGELFKSLATFLLS
jgi:hypothetical protein